MRGIYAIIHNLTGASYVGQSIDIEFRWRMHRNALRVARHDNVHLQRAWTKDGEAAFEFVVVEECAADDCTDREQFWLDRFREAGSVYNLGLCANPTWKGRTHSAESRARMSKARRGKHLPPISMEHRERIGAAQRGVPKSAEHRAKLSAANKGRPSCHKGIPKSPEHRAKLSMALRGRPLPGRPRRSQIAGALTR